MTIEKVSEWVAMVGLVTYVAGTIAFGQDAPTWVVLGLNATVLLAFVVLVVLVVVEATRGR